MTTARELRPSWYTDEDDSAWQRVKAAFRRDWRQTKHDFGGRQPELRQNVGDTVSQASGSKPIPRGDMPNPDDDMLNDPYNEKNETAYRYGFAAYRHHGGCCDWDADLEAKLRSDWNDDAEWQKNRPAIRRGWFFAKNQSRDDI